MSTETPIVRNITWTSLVRLAPELAALRTTAKLSFHQAVESGSCTCQAWYFDIKPRLRQIVGGSRRTLHPVLSSDEALDAAQWALDALRKPCGERCPF